MARVVLWRWIRLVTFHRRAATLLLPSLATPCLSSPARVAQRSPTTCSSSTSGRNGERISCCAECACVHMLWHFLSRIWLIILTLWYGLVMSWLGQWTHNSAAWMRFLAVSLLCSNLRQVVYTYVLLSPSSINGQVSFLIGKGSDAVWLGRQKVTTGLVQNTGSCRQVCELMVPRRSLMITGLPLPLLFLSVLWYNLPSVLWHCWLGITKSIRSVKIEWWGVDVVICLCEVQIVCM